MKHTTTVRFLASLCLVALIVLIAGCSSNGGGGIIVIPGTVIAAFEAEPNDSSGTASATSASGGGAGDVDNAGDVDYWAFQATAGTVIQIQLFAARADQVNWDTNQNVVKMMLLDTDGTTVLTVQDVEGDWSWGADDLDLPCWYIKTTGTYFLCISQLDDTQGGGAYAFAVRTLGVFNLQFETEPEGMTGGNDTTATAQPITPGVVYGYYVDDEDDYYSFTITEPTLVYVETKAYRNGEHGNNGVYFDTELCLIDSDGTTELQNNDDAFWYDSGISYKLTAPGTYYIRFVEHSDVNNANYFLLFNLIPVGTLTESEPNDTAGTADAIAYGNIVSGDAGPTDDDWFAFQGTAGDIVRVWVYDADNSSASSNVDVIFMATDGTTILPDDGGDELNVWRTILTETGTHYLQIRAGIATGYCFLIERLQGAAFESEGNDTVGTADNVDVNGRAAGVIDPGGDVDVFCFTATQNQIVTVYIHADNDLTDDDGYSDLDGHGSNLDPQLTIRDATGTVLARTSITPPINGLSYTQGLTYGLPVAAVTFVAPASANFYVEVADQASTGGSDRYYQIEVR